MFTSMHTNIGIGLMGYTMFYLEGSKCGLGQHFLEGYNHVKWNFCHFREDLSPFLSFPGGLGCLQVVSAVEPLACARGGEHFSGRNELFGGTEVK